jgi:ERCC4-type nuclease
MYWAQAKQEIFRLQLLNTYNVPQEETQFRNYMNGIPVVLDSDTKEWLSSLNAKRKAGIRNLNIIVTDLPLSDYLKFAINVYYIDQQKAGRETLLVNRKNVDTLVSSAKDYWMFDSKKVLPVSYDAEGRFLSIEKGLVNPADITKAVRLRDELLRVAKPIDEFLKENSIDISPPKAKTQKKFSKSY